MKKIVALTLSCALAGTLFLSACSVERVDTSTDPDAAGKDFIECLNPNSLEVLTGCKVESALVEEAKMYDAEGEGRTAKTAPGFQFMRVGYFCMDSRDCHADHLVFNRSVLLKDSFKPGK